jgi:hypothetical protein
MMARRNMWPTPNVMDSHDSELMSDPIHWQERARRKKAQGINLQFPLRVAVRMWPTPAASDGRNWKSGYHSLRNPQHLGHQDVGKLNPPWVEWLMGWPIGWTDLEPLATDKFRQWYDSHGKR